MKTSNTKRRMVSKQSAKAEADLLKALRNAASKKPRRPSTFSLVATDKKPKIKGERIRIHQDTDGDLYCIYVWVGTRIDASKLPPQVPPGAVIPDDVCIYCPKPQGHQCRKTRSVSWVPGIWWDLRIGNIPTCTHCLTGPHFEVIPN